MGLWFDSVFVLIAIFLVFCVRPVRFGMDGYGNGYGGDHWDLDALWNQPCLIRVYIMALLRLCILYGCVLRSGDRQT